MVQDPLFFSLIYFIHLAFTFNIFCFALLRLSYININQISIYCVRQDPTKSVITVKAVLDLQISDDILSYCLYQC